jgi:two-component system, LuxR family, sensor kinase FixL
VELIPEAGRQAALRHVASLASDPRPRTYEHQVLAPGGSVRWQQWVDHAIVQPDGRITEFQGIGRDVSDRKRTEETLLDSEERLQLALEAGGMGVWDWDVRANTMLWSKEYYTIMGIEPFSVDLTHRTWADLVHPEDLPLAERAMAKALAEGTAYQGEYRVVRPDGSVIWIEARGHPIYEDGRCVRVMGLVVDVTDRRRAQEADQKLAHASRLAVVGELTASIAHEINQPLGAILSNADAAEMLLESGTARLAEVRHILEDIRKDDVRASEVVRRIRRLLQKHEFEIQPYDLNEVVADVVRLVSADATRRSVAIATNIAQLPILHGDRVQMLQVLLNVILNGLDAMAATPDGRRQITIRTARGAEGGMEVSITDAGHGIPPDRLPRIFESFYTTKKDGMGLGLSIARSIVEAHGGRIQAENNGGGGATFRITLPVDAARWRS